MKPRFTSITKHLAVLALPLLIATAGPAAAQDDWQAGAGPTWQKTLADGRQEGKVVLAATFSALADPMSAAFERDTEIKLEVLTGTVADLYARVAREAKAGDVTVDLSMSGGIQFPMLKGGFLLPIKPQFMLPKVTDAKYWIGGHMEWMDNEKEYMFEGTNWVHAWPLVNSQLVDLKTFTSWKDLLKPEFKGRLHPRIRVSPALANLQPATSTMCSAPIS